MKFLRSIYLLPIRYYKRFISIFTGNGCIYTPTCSSYFYQAVSKKGIIVGTILGLFRIIRCNPFCRGGFDPVKENYKNNRKWLL